MMSFTRMCMTALAFGLSACIDVSAPVPPVAPLKDLHSQLILTPDAVVMVVGDRNPISVAALNLLGEPFSVEGGAPVVWTSTDTSSVAMEADGMIHAKRVTSDFGVILSAKWKHNGIERGGSVFVTVTPTKYPISRIKLVPKDSTRTSWSNISDTDAWVGFSVIGVNDNGDSLAAFTLPVAASRPSIAPFYWGEWSLPVVGAPYIVTSRVVGPYWLNTHVTAYGVLLRDSVQFTGLYAHGTQIPITRDAATNTVASLYANQEVVVQPCGEVRFNNQTQTSIDIVFDEPQKATGCVPGNPTGNIEDIRARRSVGRKFRAVGTVQWTLRDRTTGELVPSVRGRITMKEP